MAGREARPRKPFFFIMKKCKECDNLFQSTTSQVYCCNECKKKYSNRRKLENYHKTKKFPIVKCEECGSEFEKTWGNTKYCSNECKTGIDGKFHVYVLKEVNYAGMTRDIKSRIKKHKNTKGITTYEVLGSYDCPKRAHLHETQLHIDGYDGFYVERSYS